MKGCLLQKIDIVNGVASTGLQKSAVESVIYGENVENTEVSSYG